MVGPIIDEHDAIFGLKGFKNFATSWAFRSFSCTYRCLDVLKVWLVKPNWWRVSGRWWHFHVMIFHDISWQSFVWSILHIFVNVCYGQDCIFHLKKVTWGFCPRWPNAELIPMMVLRPLAQSWLFCLTQRQMFLCPSRYLVEVYLGRFFSVLYWKVAWLSTSKRHHGP